MTDGRPGFGRGLISVSEAATRAGVSRQAVHQWFAQGRLAPIQTDDGYRIELDALSRFLTERRAAAAVGIKLDTLRQWSAEAG